MPLSKPIGRLEQCAVQCLQGSITLIPQGWQLFVFTVERVYNRAPKHARGGAP